MDDADINLALKSCVLSALGSNSQRFTCLRRLVL